MNHHKKSILITTILVTNLIVTSPTYAADLSSIKSLVQQFLDTYNSLQESIKKYSKDFSLSWDNILDGVEDLISSTNGDLGTPDPLSAGERIKKAIEEKKKSVAVPTIDTPAEIYGDNAQREWHQKYTQAQSKATLGASGQKIQAQEAEMSNDALTQSSNYAEAAQNDVITQDILKKIAIQNLQGTIINKSLHSEAQKTSRALAAANINLSDISSRMDEQALSQQSQTRALVRQVILSSAPIEAFWANQ